MIKKLFLIPFLLLIFNDPARSQGANFVWVKQLGNLSYDVVSWIHTDPSGNVLASGVANGSEFLKKYAASGTLLWTKSIASGIISTDAYDNIYLSMFFQGTIDVDPGPGVHNLTSSSKDIFVVKLDPNGNFLWASQITGGGNEFIYELDVSQNSIYLSGLFSGNADFDPGPGTAPLNGSSYGDGFLCRLDTAGAFGWVKHFQGNNNCICHSLDADNSGNVYLTGSFDGIVDIDPGPGVVSLTNTGISSSDMFLCKFDAAGNYLWGGQIGGPNGVGASVRSDAAGNACLVGSFRQIVDFDLGPATHTLASAGANFNIFICKFDPNGNLMWVKASSGSTDAYGRGITDANNNIYFMGPLTGTLDLDPGSNTYNVSSAGQNDIYFGKVNSQGDFVWGKRLGGTANEYLEQMAIDASDNLYLGGRFQNQVFFNPNVNNNLLISAGDYDAFILKLCQTPDPPLAISGATMLCSGAAEMYSVAPDPGAASYSWSVPVGWSGTSTTSNIVVTAGASSGTISVTSGNSCGNSAPLGVAVNVDICQGIEKAQGSAGYILFPNPTHDRLTVQTLSDCQLQLADNMGQIILERKLGKGENDLDLSALKSGIYFIFLKDDQKTQNYKLVKE